MVGYSGSPGPAQGAALRSQGSQSWLRVVFSGDHDRIMMVRDELGLGEERTDCVWAKANRTHLLGRQMNANSTGLQQLHDLTPL